MRKSWIMVLNHYFAVTGYVCILCGTAHCTQSQNTCSISPLGYRTLQRTQGRRAHAGAQSPPTMETIGAVVDAENRGSDTADHAGAKESEPAPARPPARTPALEEKINRLTTWDKMKPQRGTAAIWVHGFFKIYTRSRFPEYAICMLCLQQKRWASAEMKYGSNKASGNLLTHLESVTLPGHIDAWRVCRGLPPQRAAETASKTVNSDGAKITSQSALTQFFKREPPSATRVLCKMIVMEYLPLSVRRTVLPVHLHFQILYIVSKMKSCNPSTTVVLLYCIFYCTTDCCTIYCCTTDCCTVQSVLCTVVVLTVGVLSIPHRGEPVYAT